MTITSKGKEEKVRQRTRSKDIIMIEKRRLIKYFSPHKFGGEDQQVAGELSQ